jgi:ribulose-5-phosphate 4-epimerase/fuculose-1-phosphate aldolase
MNFSFLHPRDQIEETMERIYSRSMTTTSRGNISLHDENGDRWITIARMDEGSLRRQDIARLANDGACEFGFEQQFGDGSAVAGLVRPANPVVLLRHNGVLVARRTILDAFDRLEVLEATAAAIIQSRPLGPISPMSAQVKRDLLAPSRAYKRDKKQ